MSAPLIGQIAIFGFNFVPQGWAFCHGQILPITQYVPLFSILRNSYGGNGTTNFALPNLQGIPVGAGQGPGLSNRALGEAGGNATVVLTPQQMPSHSHAFNAVAEQATSFSPAGNQLAKAWKAQATTDTIASFYSDNPTTPNRAGVGCDRDKRIRQTAQQHAAVFDVEFLRALQGAVPSPGGAPAAVRQPFLGEISVCAFGNPPAGWALCDGQTLPIIRNQPLFSLLGAAYGTDGERNFALPDLRGRVPLNLFGNASLGQVGGEEAHALSFAEMPAHNHAMMADATSTSVGDTPSPATVPGLSLGKEVPGNTPFTACLYDTAAASVKLAGSSLGNSGSGRPHSNMMPSLALSFCINVNPQSPYPGR